jgi:hypothetical protein
MAHAPSVARSAAHTGNICAGLAHEREVVSGQLAGERDEQTALVHPGH